MPYMPDITTFAIHEDDDGIYSVVWASTDRVVEWNGRARRGLTLDEADDAADHMEALERMAAARRSRGLNG